MHDFIDPELGKAKPYGVYDLRADSGWVSVGTDHDTAAFAVETIRRFAGSFRGSRRGLRVWGVAGSVAAIQR
jgi:hypothetical protein